MSEPSGSPELPRTGEEPAGGRTELGAPAAHLAAWILLAIVNAAMIAVQPSRATGRVRLLHHLYDAGQLVVVGIAAYGLVTLVALVGHTLRGRVLRYALLYAGAAALATFHGAEDWTGLSQRLVASGLALPWSWLLPFALALFVPFAAWCGASANRPRWRWLAIAAGLALAIGNYFLLENGYPGVHATIVLGAGVLIGAALGTSTLPVALQGPPRRRFIVYVALAVGFLAASLTWIVRPSEAVWTALQASPGAIVAPILTQLRATSSESSGPHYYTGSPWFRDRSALKDVAPSQPPWTVSKPIVIVMTIDAMRANLVSDDKYEDKLPSLHALKKQAAFFTNARAPSPSTVTTISSILTGKYYSELYWTPMPDGPVKGTAAPYQDPSPRLEQLLGEKGVHTIHAMSLHGLAADAGLGIGFSEELKTKHDYGHADELMGLAIDGIRRSSDQPTFLYMHFVDSHAPYNLAGTKGSNFDRYLGEVALVDKQLGRLMAFLDESGLAERTLLVVSADHGEAFGEHGMRYHATTLYEELLHVPLLIRGKGIAARAVDTRVSLIDIGPTVLDVFGVPTPATFMGESIVPLLRGESQTFTRPLAADAGRRMQAMLFPDGIKVITDLNKHTLEIYDLSSDPGETDNRIDDMGERAEPYVGALREFFRVHEFKKPGYKTPWRQF